MKHSLIMALAFLATASTLSAQISVDIVKDMNPGTGNAFQAYTFTESIQFQDRVIFRADDGIHGEELWISDGTEAGTFMLKDINPGTGSSSADDYAIFDNKVYFRANNGVNGRELWVTDGTENGTYMFMDMDPGPDSGSPNGMYVFNDRFYFSASNGVNGFELWVSDGTEAGTVMLKDIRPGSANGSPQNFAAYDGKLYFRAEDGSTGEELWVTDGTEAGTRLLLDIWPGGGSNGSSPSNFIPFAGKLFFIADDGTHGTEWWYTDGTEAGTQLLKDVYPGIGGLVSANFVSMPDPVVYNGLFYFGGREEGFEYYLYVSDGTAEGTGRFEGPGPEGLRWPSGMLELNGLLYMQGHDMDHGHELWATDGTPEGTQLIKDIKVGSESAYPVHLVEYSAALYFVADDGSNGKELWRSDGTTAGTVKIVPDFGTQTNPVSMSWFQFRLAGTQLLFAANYDDRGYELFKVTDAEVFVGELELTTLQVHPNPSSGVLTITSDTPGLSQWYVADLAGRTVAQGSMQGTRSTLDLSHLPTGLWVFVRVDATGKPHHKKIVLER